MSARETEHRTLCTALAAALEAGDYIRSRVDTQLIVKTKSSISDLVTDVDPHCEAIIRGHIERSHAGHVMLGEESVAPGAEASAAAIAKWATHESLWVVDPLDGTTNFVSGLPLSVVSIAYAIRGEVRTGVVYDPFREEVFFAVRGAGSWRATSPAARSWLAAPAGLPAGVRLRVSTQVELRRAVVAAAFPGRGPNRDQHIRRGMALLRYVKGLRSLGAAALHMAYVASGRLEAFWEYDLNAWDLAAGALLVEEAGGIVRDMAACGAYQLVTRDVIAGGHPDVVHRIEAALTNPSEEMTSWN